MKTPLSSSELEILSSCPIFEGMDRAQMSDLLDHTQYTIMDFPSGSEIPCNGMIILLHGKALIEKPASDGRTLLMREAVPPEVVNVASALLDDSNMSRIITPNGCRALHISGDALAETISRGGSFAVNITRFLVGRVVFLNKKISSLAGYTAASRLTMYLSENAKTVNGTCSVTLPCSLTDFAEYLGLGRASLYRTLDAMEAAGKIKRRGRIIQILKNF